MNMDYFSLIIENSLPEYENKEYYEYTPIMVSLFKIYYFNDTEPHWY